MPFRTLTMPDPKRLESWKEIAAYLNREVRTARRWETERGLPVHRIPGKRSGVYALPAEIDAWLKTGTPDGSGNWRLTPFVGAAGVLLLAIAVLSGLTTAKSVTPRLRHPVRITNDGLLKSFLFSAGHSLFFISGGGERRTLRRISEGGGEASIILFPSNNFALLDLSRDGSQSLVRKNDPEGCEGRCG